MAKEAFHVVPNGDGWAVKREGHDRNTSTHDTQKMAIDSARETAKEGDEIVIHRADGTIRETVTYAGSRSGGNGSSTPERIEDRPRFHDIWSVGSRVRWSAILAGAVVALANAALLTAFAAAVGIPLLDRLTPRTLAVTTAVAAIFILLASLFVGGFVASRMTTRETPAETVIYGVLVWGIFVAIGTMGLGAGARLGLDVYNTARAEERSGAEGFWSRVGANGDTGANEFADRVGLNEEQRRKLDQVRQESDEALKRSSATGKAWWAFAGLLLPLLAAIGGALAGCGHDPTRRVRPGEAPPVGVENRISQYERAGV